MSDTPSGTNARRVGIGVALVVVLATVAVVLVTSSRSGPPEAGSATPSSGNPAGPESPGTTVEPLEGAPQGLVLELQGYVEEARGLPFLHDVPVELAPDEEFELLVDEIFAFETAEIAATAAYYEALGLIPPGSAAYFAEQIRERYRSMLGFYDPESQRLIVRGLELNGGVRAVIVHELVHALDDQWFGLTRPVYELDATTELVTSFPMVTEGDATRIESMWIADQPPDVQAEARQYVGDDPSGRVTDYANIIDFGLLAPYGAGAAFVSSVAATGGERLVDAVIIDPPETTEQVLFPEVFDRREGRLRVPPPPVDGPVVDQGVVGAFFWLGLLTSAEIDGGVDAAVAAVRGWGGDWEISWVRDDMTCTRTDVVGDTTNDTFEFFEAMAEWARSRPQVSVTNPDGRVRLEVCYRVPIIGPNAR